MDDNKQHTTRLAVVLVALVLVLVIISVNQFMGSNDVEQQASVLRAYAP